MVPARVFVWLPRDRRRRDGAACPGSQRVRDQGQVGRHSSNCSVINMIVPVTCRKGRGPSTCDERA